jgi:hypothetical protein
MCPESALIMVAGGGPPPTALANDAHMQAEPEITSSMSWHTNIKHVPDQDRDREQLS